MADAAPADRGGFRGGFGSRGGQNFRIIPNFTEIHIHPNAFSSHSLKLYYRTRVNDRLEQNNRKARLFDQSEQKIPKRSPNSKFGAF